MAVVRLDGHVSRALRFMEEVLVLYSRRRENIKKEKRDVRKSVFF